MSSSHSLLGPAADELEISLFGPGFGESLVVHLGNGQWMIVDSCLDPQTGRPAAIDYLESIGVDCTDAVALVVATHWHDDHVRGLSDVFKLCESACFAYGGALQTHEFLTLVGAPPSTVRMTPGSREFASALETLLARKNAGAGPRPLRKVLVEDRLLHKSELVEVVAMSPSTEAMNEAIQAFAAQLPEHMRPQLRIAAPSPNAASVALWVEGLCGSALLGADLVADGRDDRGWGAVLALARRGKAGLVKVPHHGGESAHDQRMWEKLLRTRPQAMLTPWRLAGKSLPTEADIARICGLAPEAVMAGRAYASPGRFVPPVERTLKEIGKSRRAVGTAVGHVRARCGSADLAGWRVERVREARRLCQAA